MSKTADRNKASVGNTATQQAQTSNSAPQAQPASSAPAPATSSDSLAQQILSLSSDLDNMKKKYDTCAHAVIKMGSVVKDHDVAIEDLGNRVSALETCMKNCGNATATPTSSAPAQATAPTPAQPVATAQASAPQQTYMTRMYQFRLPGDRNYQPVPVADLLLAEQLAGYNMNNWRVRDDCLVNRNGDFVGFASDEAFRKQYVPNVACSAGSS